MPKLVLTTLTPISLRAGRAQTESKSLMYIPGSTVLGSLAAAHTRLRPNQRDEFAAFFLRDQCIFGNLYPATFNHEDLDDEEQPVYPLPRTARTCKRFPGFRFGADREREERHGCFDDLIAWTVFMRSDQQVTALLDANKACSHPDCTADIDRAEGYYRRGFDPEQIGQPETGRGLRTRTGISRVTGAVAQGILYNREIIHTDQQFWGTVTVADAQLEHALQGFIKEAAGRGLIRLGNNRTRGFGRVNLGMHAHEEATQAELAERAHAFDAQLRATAQDVQVTLPHAFYLPITLVSDTLLYDRLLRHQLHITGDYLAERWAIAGAELVYQNTGRERIAGWHDIWGLPRADEWGIAMGSVFLFGLPAEPDFAQLARMQREGIGARRSEGFGQVRIADAFHQEVTPL